MAEVHYTAMDTLQAGWDQLQAWVLTERLRRRQYLEVNVLNGIVGFSVILAPFLLFLILPDFDSGFLMIPVAAIGIAAAIGIPTQPLPSCAQGTAPHAPI